MKNYCIFSTRNRGVLIINIAYRRFGVNRFDIVKDILYNTKKFVIFKNFNKRSVSRCFTPKK
jgi:hypothetical protein